MTHDNILKSRTILKQNVACLPLKTPPIITVHMFWAYGNLINLELLSVKSFIAHGYKVNFWTYGKITNLPTEALQCDAREIIPENRVFKYKNGSYAGFANLFRYWVLSEKTGLWSDTDVICLLPMSELRESGIDGFLVTERMKGLKDKTLINNNLIYYPEHKRGSIIDLALAVSDRFDVEKLEWGYCGPRLLTTLVETYAVLAPTIMEPNFANPLDYWECPHKLLDHNLGMQNIPASWAFLHCYNESWRIQSIDKNSNFPFNSILSNLKMIFDNGSVDTPS